VTATFEAKTVFDVALRPGKDLGIADLVRG